MHFWLRPSRVSVVPTTIETSAMQRHSRAIHSSKRVGFQQFRVSRSDRPFRDVKRERNANRHLRPLLLNRLDGSRCGREFDVVEVDRDVGQVASPTATSPLQYRTRITAAICIALPDAAFISLGLLIPTS